MSNLYEVTNWKRLITAFLAAPLITPLVLIFAEILDGALNLHQNYFGSFLFYGIYAYLAATIFGIPAYLLYRKMRWSNFMLFVVGGGMIGWIFPNLIIGPINFVSLLSPESALFASAGAISALVFRLILGMRDRRLIKFVVHISIILLMFSSLTAQAQSTGKPKSASPPKTATQPKKIQGWAVKVIGFEGVRFEYVTFNSAGVGGYYRTHWMGVTGYRRPPVIGSILSSTAICTFNLSEKLANETKSVMANLHPNNWKEVYGSNIRFLRPFVTIFYTDGTSTVYQTTWKVSNEIPKDLSQLLDLRDKVFDQRTCR